MVADGILSWLSFAGIPHAAIDTDVQHHTSSDRYKMHLLDATSSEDEFEQLLENLPESPTLIVVFPGNKTSKILEFADMLKSFRASRHPAHTPDWHNQRWRAPNTQGGSPVRESCTPGSVRGVLSNGHCYRDSGIEEGGARISQRPKCLLKRLGWPDVVAIEADVLPAERGNVGERLVRQRFALGAKLCNGAAEVDGVPEDDGGDREAEAGGTVALIFEGAVPDLALARAFCRG
jgi:hypothetical protein